MARQPSPEIDDELFNEVYGKEYTGPPRPTFGTATVNSTNKRPLADPQSDEEDASRDPNAVPTDFTSREAKVWEAKAKATERNWKKRKEEELICKICGESGHFTQGCPSTLGPSRKSADFFERVPARDKNVRALFSERVISQIEKDIGCKIKMDEKFLIVSGKDRLILAKGVDAVHKVIQDGDKGKKKSSVSSHISRSKSPDGSPVGSHFRRSESHRSHSSPRNTSRFPNRGYNQDRFVEVHTRQDLQKLRGSPPARAYANDGAKGRSAHSKSPAHPTYGSDAFSSYDGHDRNPGMRMTDKWDVERRESEVYSDHKFDCSAYPQTLEELETEFKQEAIEVGRICDKEEDEENYRHRECIRELRDDYMQKLGILRAMHAKQWEEFLQLDVRRRQQARRNAYNQPVYTDYDQSSRSAQSMGTNLPMEPRGRYAYPGENYSSSRPNDAYAELQHPRQNDYGKSYTRY